MKREYVVIPIISCFMTLALLFALGALPQQFKSARMTDSTLATSIDDEVGNAESAHAQILGIPEDTDINNALFAVTGSGLTKVLFQDLAGDPAASGELARNGTDLKYHDGTSARTAAFLDSTQTLTNKTLAAANNVIDADTAVVLAANGANCAAGEIALGVDDAGAVEGCYEPAFTDVTGTVGDTQIAAGAVDGGVGGEIADGTVDANDLGVDSVSASELNATGVESELEAVLDLNQLQGQISDSQIADGAVDGGTGGEIADESITAADLAPNSVGSSELQANIVGTGDLNTATGSQSSTANQVSVVMNDYSFFPSFDFDDCSGSVNWYYLRLGPLSVANDTVGRVQLVGDTAGTCTSGSIDIRWRYVTSSRPAEIVIRRAIGTGEVNTVWVSEIENESVSPIEPAIGQEVLNLSDFPDRIIGSDSKVIFNELRSGSLVIDRVVRGAIPPNDPIRLVAEVRGRKWIRNVPMARAR